MTCAPSGESASRASVACALHLRSLMKRLLLSMLCPSSCPVPAALLALAACGTSTRFATLNQPPHPLTPRPAEAVVLFSSALPAQPYVEIGIVQGKQESDISVDELPEILAAMRVEAGRRGCEGLILNGPSNAPGARVLGPFEGANRTIVEGFWATCIAFTDQVELAGPVNLPPPPFRQPGERVGAGRLREAPPAPEATPPPSAPAEPPPPRLPPAPAEPPPPAP